MDEAQAALPARRATPSSITPSGRSTSACTATRKRPTPTPTTSTCCRTRTAARRPPGRAPRSASCARSASARRFEIEPGVERPAAHGAVPAGEREDHRQGAKVNGGPPMDFVLDTGSEQTVISRETASAPRHPADHLHAQRRRRRRRAARAAARADRLARDRLAEGAQRAVPHQEPAAAWACRRARRKASRRWRSGMSMIIDYDSAAAHHGSERCRSSRPTSSCRCGMHRLAMVPGHVHGAQPANFVVDTGGEVISISPTRRAASSAARCGIFR